MGWLARLLGSGPDAPRVIAAVDDQEDDSADDPATAPFACADCGRTDLPEAGGWDPPICQECDAAINQDALCEMDDFDA